MHGQRVVCVLEVEGFCLFRVAVQRPNITGICGRICVCVCTMLGVNVCVPRACVTRLLLGQAAAPANLVNKSLTAIIITNNTTIIKTVVNSLSLVG